MSNQKYKKFKNPKKNDEIHGKERSEINDGFLGFKKNFGELLPSPAILESYEETSPGIVQKFGDMLKIEQEHRHFLENRYLTAVIVNMRLGQLISAIIICFVLYMPFIIIKELGSYVMAVIELLGGIGFLVFINIMAKNHSEQIADKLTVKIIKEAKVVKANFDEKKYTHQNIKIYEKNMPNANHNRHFTNNHNAQDVIKSQNQYSVSATPSVKKDPVINNDKVNTKNRFKNKT